MGRGGDRSLLERAGARPQVAAEDVRAITGAARSAWQARHAGEKGLRADAGLRRRAWWAAAALAAGVVLALGVAVSFGWWWRARPAAEPAAVASVETIAGAVTILDADGRARAAQKEQALAAGAAVVSGDGRDGAPGRALLRLADGGTVRLDRGSLVRLVSGSVLALERGAIYVDSEAAGRQDRGARRDGANGRSRSVRHSVRRATWAPASPSASSQEAIGWARSGPLSRAVPRSGFEFAPARWSSKAPGVPTVPSPVRS